MNSLWPLAVITFKEGIRNRSMYGISILALMLLGANFLISGMIMHDVGKVAVDFALSTVAFSGLLIVLFVGINLMAKDLDRKTIYIVLSRSISRGQYIIGKFLGISLLVLTVMVVLSFFAFVSIFLIKFAHPFYFNRFSWPPVFLAIFLSAFSLILLTALSVLFSTFSSSSFITLILTIMSYLIGHSLTDVKKLVAAPQAAGIDVSPITIKIIDFSYYLFPNLSLFDLKTQAAYNLDVPLAHISWILAYGALYTGAVILLATMVFAKKEFP